MLSKIKRHINENRKLYLMGTTCVLTGAAVAALYYHKIIIPGLPKAELINAPTLTTNGDNSPIVSIIQTLERRGHPGNVIQCVETGEIFASQRRVCEVFDISSSALSKHLNGLKESIKDLHFKRLGEMQ